jgi:hypothetical protein
MSSHSDSFVASGSSPTSSPDFICSVYGSLYLLRPLNQTARLWIETHIHPEHQTFADSVVIEMTVVPKKMRRRLRRNWLWLRAETENVCSSRQDIAKSSFGLTSPKSFVLRLWKASPWKEHLLSRKRQPFIRGMQSDLNVLREKEMTSNLDRWRSEYSLAEDHNPYPIR